MTGENELPVRIFATNHYPVKRRLNIYSKPDIINFVESKLSGTDELKRIKESQFGYLFDLPAIQCTTSCKLIQTLMARQLCTKRKYEMWSVFGGKPLRFSIIEFAALTRLNCDELEDEYDNEDNPSIPMGAGSTWEEYIGDPKANLSDVADLFDSVPDMPGWRKFGLALILIIDGVLVANLQVHKPTPKYVDMLSDIEGFLKFPWGRVSFLKTIASLTPPKSSGMSGFAGFTKAMLQPTFTVKGFPQVLQLLAYKAIPSLLDKLPNSSFERKLMEVSMVDLQKLTTLTTNDIREVEFADNLVVKPMLPPKDGLKIGWIDEIKDKKVKHLVQLIKEDHCFKKEEWLGGDISEPKFVYEAKKTTLNQKRQIVGRSKAKTPVKSTTVKQRKPVKTRSSSRKQTRLDEFYEAAPLTLEEVNIKMENHIAKTKYKYEKMAEELKQIKALNKKYVRLLKQNRRVHFGKLSSGKGFCYRRSNRKSAKVSEQTPQRSEEVQTDEETTHVARGNGSTSPPMGLDQSEVIPGSLVRKQRPPQLLDEIEDDSPTIEVGVGHQTPLVTDEYGGRCYRRKIRKKNMFNDEVGEESEPKEDFENTEVTPQEPDIDEVGYEAEARIEVQNPEVSPQHLGDKQTDELTPLKQGYEGVRDEPEPGENVETPECKQDDLSRLVTDKSEDHSCLVRKRRAKKIDITEAEPQNDKGNIEQTLDNLDSEDKQKQAVVEPITTIVCYRPFANTQPFKSTFEKESKDPMEVATDPIEIIDNTPPRKRQRSQTSSYDEQICNVIRANRKKQPRESSELFPDLDHEAYDLLGAYIKKFPTRCHTPPHVPDFQNKFLLQLATPQYWLISSHMESLMAMLGKLHHQVLQAERSRFVSPWLNNLIYSKKTNFERAKDKNRVRWPENTVHFIKTFYGEWLEDVDTVYIPMSLQNKHWVGLVINLHMSSIEVLDANCSVVSETRLHKLLDHLARSLPYVLKKFCNIKNVINRGVTPFSIQRTTGLYQDETGGDCGPIAVKFMEMHLYGGTHAAMFHIDEKTVDTLRKQYVLDLYADILVPLYS